MKLKDLNRIDLPETELCKIGGKYKTDKPWHRYTRVYYEIMKDFRYDPVDIFEIGIYFGASIKMWEEFFPNGKIYGIDNGRMIPGSKILVGGMDGTHINILSSDDVKMLQPEAIVENLNYGWLENNRVKCFTADQRSEKQLQKALEYFKCNKFVVILDDAHHFVGHQQKSLAILYPNIKPGRYYIIEDIQTHEALINGSFLGQRRKDATDSTVYLFENFIKTGKLESPWMTQQQIDYIVDNTEDIFMYQNSNKDNSPVSGTSKLLVIKKK